MVLSFLLCHLIKMTKMMTCRVSCEASGWSMKQKGTMMVLEPAGNKGIYQTDTPRAKLEVTISNSTSSCRCSPMFVNILVQLVYTSLILNSHSLSNISKPCRRVHHWFFLPHSGLQHCLQLSTCPARNRAPLERSEPGTSTSQGLSVHHTSGCATLAKNPTLWRNRLQENACVAEKH